MIIKTYGDKSRLPMYWVNSRGISKIPIARDKNEAPITIRIIMLVVLTAANKHPSKVSQPNVRLAQANKTAASTPRAVASVTVAIPM
jgi:hypothetical protein